MLLIYRRVSRFCGPGFDLAAIIYTDKEFCLKINEINVQDLYRSRPGYKVPPLPL